jgi:CMP-N-acetylneuraminic acid synthetase
LAEVLAIIPARGGSKSIPRKNITLVNGRPLISYTIQAALDTCLVSRVIVSTDDSEIASVSIGFGAEVPFLRPQTLALDTSPTIEVVLHALDQLEANESYSPDITVLLQPTSPLRDSRDIDQAISLFLSSDCDLVVSVTRVKEHPYNMYKVENGNLCPIIQRDQNLTSRHDYPLIYRLNGAVYVARPLTLRTNRSFIKGKLVPYEMPAERSLDVDEPIDLCFASVLLSRKEDVSNS